MQSFFPLLNFFPFSFFPFSFFCFFFYFPFTVCILPDMENEILFRLDVSECSSLYYANFVIGRGDAEVGQILKNSLH